MIHSRVDLHHQPKAILGCSVDPITLTGLALGGLGALGGAAAGGAFGGASAPAAPAAPPPQAPPQVQPQGSPTQTKPQQSTFIGAAATPPTQSGQKTLLGQ